MFDFGRIGLPYIHPNLRSRILLPNRRLAPALPRAIHQPQRIHPPRRVQGVPIPIEPTRQLARVRRQVAARFRIVVAVPVVVQAAFRVEVLALEAQRLFQLFAAAVFYRAGFAVAVVARRPDDLAAVVGQFLGRAQVVEVVVERAGVEAFAVEQGQWAEGARFVEVAAVVLAAAS